MLGALVFYAVYAWLVFGAPHSETNQLWAFFSFDELPPWARIAAVLAPLVLFFLPKSLLGAVVQRWARLIDVKTHRCLLYGLTALCAFALFWALRENRLWGDGPTIVGVFDGRLGVGAISGIFYWVYPLEHLLVIAIMKMSYLLLHWSARKAIALLSVLAGVAFVLLLLPIARRLASTSHGRAFVLLFPLTMGAGQLWFGHVEHYSRVAVLILATILAALRFLREGRGAWLVFLIAAIALTSHPQALCLMPGLCFLPLLRPRGERGNARAWILSLLPACAYLLLIFAVSHLLGAGRVELNPWKMRFLFLPRELTFIHFWNVLQNWILVTPLGVALIGCDFLRVKRFWRDPTLVLLLLFAASYVPFTILFNHGMARLREWSLFAPAAVPLSLLVAYGHVRYTELNRKTMLRGLAALLISASFTFAWVASNHIHSKRPILQVAGNESDQNNILRGVLTPTRNAVDPQME